MKKVIFFSLVLLFCLISASAQDKFTVAEFSYNFAPGSKYENPDLKSNIGYLSGVFNFPVFSKGKATFLAGMRSNMWSVNYDTEQEWPEDYYSLGLTLTYNQKFSSDNSFLFVFIPRYNSDLLNSSSDAWQFGFLSYYIKRSSEKYLWKVGAYVNTEFFGLFAVPIYGIDWRINSRWSFTGDIPIWAKLNYKASEKLNLGFSYMALVSSYRLTGEFNNDYISRFAIEPVFYAEIPVVKNLYLKGKIGYTLGRDYPVYDRDDKLDWKLSMVEFGDERTPLNSNIKDGMFFEISIAYNVDITKK